MFYGGETGGRRSGLVKSKNDNVGGGEGGGRRVEAGGTSVDMPTPKENPKPIIRSSVSVSKLNDFW
jgi:hypothetical protein